MKPTAMTYLYPFIMKGIIRKQLLRYYESAEVKQIIKSTNKEYSGIIKRAPDIGGYRNIFTSSYLMGAYLIGLYKQVNNKLSIDEMNETITDGLRSFSYMKRMMQKQDLLSIGYKEKIINAGAWCDRNQEKYPTNWLVSVYDKEDPNLTHMVFTRCGLCALCTNENVPEFISCLCATDYITMSFAKCHLERPTTLGKGDKTCNFLITRIE